MSANHDGYEQAMKVVFSILDTHRVLGGKTQQNEDSLEAIRIALERFRAANLQCAREADERVAVVRGAMKEERECCHGTKNCEGQGDKHWCAAVWPMARRLESVERRIVVLEETAHGRGSLSYVNGRLVAEGPIKTAAPSESSEGRLTEAEAAVMLEKLRAHFGEPVMPVGQYCAALNLWASALRDKADRFAAVFAPTVREKEGAEEAFRFASEVGHVFMQIGKSNLLHRLIYQGESLRTEPCPVHKGVWSGCVPPGDNPCACQGVQGGGFGSNVTGWLP